MIAIIAIILVVTHKSKFDLAKYTNVKFDGYNTCGTAELDFDYENFFKDLSKKAKKSKGSVSSSQKKALKELFGSDVDSYSDYSDLYEDIDFQIDKKKNLSNSDTVTVTFSGTSPDAYAEVNVESSEEALDYVSFDLSKRSDIAKGDKIIATIKCEENDILEYCGVKFTKKTKEFVCDNVYAAKVDEIPGDALATIKKEAESEIKDYFKSEKDYYSITGLKYEGSYFLNSKSYGSNQGYAIYSATLKSKKKWFKPTKVYYPVTFSDVIIKADGSSEVDVSYARVSGSSKLGRYYIRGYSKLSEMYKKLVEDYADRYTSDVTKGLK